VQETKAGKQELKPWESAEASASFAVKPLEPPTIGCSARPSTIKPGETSTVTASAVSPQNRPLRYGYSAASGTISGTGTTARFDSAGAPTGSTAIVCNVSDDKRQTATASTSVTIMAPYVAPAPRTQSMCSISFSKDTKRPARVDNEAKACLDEVALSLQSQPDSKVVIVSATKSDEQSIKKTGKHAETENLAAQRAVNTKDYLVTEKGIDASRVSVREGGADGQTAINYLVPSGANFTADVAGTAPVDESTVRHQPRKSLTAKSARRKAGAITTVR
jgi:outer membrane protein OmpA-like peptidoglycan-associated protein